ncbi:histidinol-phosphate transaminase [Lysobacter sp. LF1]|uniref:Histidinol-phosphate aminotransferase n=1 Tax=Lysobacter stagni TaxID=3045172 RepID=A0ABT6XHE7_9GAMM|nr:histidinol-phosphate transaminase [Lysobacter sp. LF1]MDI9239498.1 histidinol-phosphate transaminase [Lysobacter sp. LF1]
MSAMLDSTAPPSGPLTLLREDLRDFGGYRSARSERLQGRIWLNANESPWANPADADGALRRYPDPQPQALREALAALYGCTPEQLLVGRGSDEGIDLLVRAVCRPGGDAIVVSTPTFGMYAVSARLHGTRVIDVPLREADGAWQCDLAAIGDVALEQGARIVFLCSPGNPTGALIPLDGIAALASRLEGRALLVVDEAYLEYALAPSALTLMQSHRNVVVLRTLSKAHALAAARIGSVIADAELIEALRRCQAPYPLPSACVDEAFRALAADAVATTRARVATVRDERESLWRALGGLPGVRRAYPSTANFVLVRFEDAQDAFERLLAAGVVVRDMRAARGLGDALRISIGTPEQNTAVLSALSGGRA